MDVEPSSAQSTRFQKFRLLLWKNFLWHRYYWWWTIMEILSRSIIPIFIGYSVIRGDIYKPIEKPPTIPPMKNRTELLQTFTNEYKYIAYTPSTPFTDQLLTNAIKTLGAVSSEPIELVKLSDERELELYTLNRTINNITYSPIGIVFLEIESNGTIVPNKFVYKLRHGFTWDAKHPYHLWHYTPGPYQVPLNLDPQQVHLRADYKFWDGGIAALQLLVNEEFLRLKINSSSWSVPQPFFQALPYPKYEDNREKRENALFVLFYIYLVFGTFLFVPFLASVINEKRYGTKELMKIYGVEEWMIWLCWFINAFTMSFISITLMTVMFYIPMRGPRSEILNYVSFYVVWITFLLYDASSISLILFFGAIFNRATTASVTFLFFTYFVYIAIVIIKSFNVEPVVTNIFPVRILMHEMNLIRLAEMHGVNADLASTNVIKLSGREHETLFIFYILSVIDVIIYAVLAILVNLGIIGRLKSRLFRLKSSFFSRGDKLYEEKSLQKVQNFRINRIEKKADNLILESQELDHGETGSSVFDHEPLLRIEELYKNYGDVHALKGIDVEFRENEVNLILGHKGAGKSTLFSILTGSIPYDHGTIHYKGIDITSNMDDLKKTAGISLKIEGLFNHLSVIQHLIFYGMLKGLSKSDAIEQAENFLIRMEMQEETKSAFRKLSLIEKKKLSIATSLIGEREIFFLDEPMAGLDAHSKINVWNILMDMRSHRTIILTSNYDKEAEMLADRITVMENGVVTAHGTHDYFKQYAGHNYELLISGSTMNSSEVSDVVQNNVNAIVERETDHDIIYKIPVSESPKFQHLFERLEQDVQSLGISTVNVTFETIQDLLMKNGTLSGHYSLVSSQTADILRLDSLGRKGGLGLRLRQMGSLFKRRILTLKRDYVSILIRIIIPTFVVLVLIRIIEINDFDPYPVMKLSPKTFAYPKFLLHNKTPNQDLIKLYSDYLKSEDVSVYISNRANIIESLIEFGEKDILSYRRDLIAGIEINGMATTGILYNLFGKYTLSIAIDTYSNVLLKSSTKDESSKIIAYHHPLPVYFEAFYCSEKEKNIRLLTYFCFLFFLFGYLSNEVILYLFEFTNKEIASGLMHLEIMSGVPKWIYWWTTFAFDLLFFVIVVVFRIALCMLLDNFVKFFDFNADFGIFILLMLIHAITSLFCSYIISYFYRPESITYSHLFLFNMAWNAIGVLLLFMRNELIFPNVLTESSTLMKVVLCLPLVNYLFTIQNYLFLWGFNHLCSTYCLPIAMDSCLKKSPRWEYFEFRSEDNEFAMLLEFICLIITLVFSGILFILINFGIVDVFRKLFIKSTSQDHLDDDNVVEERIEIQTAKEDESRYHQVPLIVDGLGKTHISGFRHKAIVEDVSFMAQHGTCFGILGGYDTGKITTFDMMTAQVHPTQGDVSVEGVRMRGDRKQYFSMVAYCPRTSPLLDKFTGREMLMFIASLRGIDDDIDSLVDELISATGLENIQHLRCESYSNGSKRVLSTVLSLIGNPSVIFLDEPANDVDSESRRQVYDIIEQVKESGKVVVLGSASPKECELLCDRVTLLINGVMHCIGNPQDIKTKFSLGYFIMIKIHLDSYFLTDVHLLEENVIEIFGSESCRVIADYKGLIYFLITDHSIPLSILFQRMEKIKEDNSIIEEYAISTSTLENIFDSLTHSKELF